MITTASGSQEAGGRPRPNMKEAQKGRDTIIHRLDTDTIFFTDVSIIVFDQRFLSCCRLITNSQGTVPASVFSLQGGPQAL